MVNTKSTLVIQLSFQDGVSVVVVKIGPPGSSQVRGAVRCRLREHFFGGRPKHQAIGVLPPSRPEVNPAWRPAYVEQPWRIRYERPQLGLHSHQQYSKFADLRSQECALGQRNTDAADHTDFFCRIPPVVRTNASPRNGSTNYCAPFHCCAHRPATSENRRGLAPRVPAANGRAVLLSQSVFLQG
jgi:hypothetical protein